MRQGALACAATGVSAAGSGGQRPTEHGGRPPAGVPPLARSPSACSAVRAPSPSGHGLYAGASQAPTPEPQTITGACGRHRTWKTARTRALPAAARRGARPSACKGAATAAVATGTPAGFVPCRGGERWGARWGVHPHTSAAAAAAAAAASPRSPLGCSRLGFSAHRTSAHGVG
eukprot:scaffold7734_cov592-Prasinococcus_capsulatus_cf.AAC.9